MNDRAFDPLAAEHRALIASYGKAQARCSDLVARQASEIETLKGEVMRLRAEVIIRDTRIAFLQADQGATPSRFKDQSVVCVSPDESAAQFMMSMVEKAGGRFSHDPVEGVDDLARIESSMHAADLVICQTGCLSHDAIWRVRDHCSRTGKPCLFVEQPMPLAEKQR